MGDALGSSLACLFLLGSFSWPPPDGPCEIQPLGGRSLLTLGEYEVFSVMRPSCYLDEGRMT